MIRTTRRGMMAGALAVPTIAGLAQYRWQHGERSVLLFDEALAAGRRFSDAGTARGADVRAIEGDRVRVAQEVLKANPALIAGVSRHADFIVVEDVAREAGYRPVATVYGRDRQCAGHECQPGWQSLGQMAQGAGEGWIEVLADYAARPGEAVDRLTQGRFAGSPSARVDSGMVLGWVLALKG